MGIYIIFTFLLSYFVCSLNPAIEICKKKTGQDIRNLGSGNAGPANSMRVLGRLLGFVVIFLDVLKVVLTFLAILLINKIFKFELSSDIKSAFILGTVFGDCFPVYYKFKGGKGIVAGITLMFLLDYKVAIICLIASIIILLITKTVSISTIVGLMLYFLISLVLKKEYIAAIVIVFLVIMFKHRNNIHRIITRQEEEIK